MEILPIVMRALNMAAAAILLSYTIAACFEWQRIKSVVYIYSILLCPVFGILDFYALAVCGYVQYLYSGWGRSAAYVAFALLMLDGSTTSSWCGSLMLTIGVLYAVTSFFTSPRGAVPTPLFSPNVAFDPRLTFVGDAVPQKSNLPTFHTDPPADNAEKTGEV